MNTIQAAMKSLFSPPSLPAQPARGTFPLFQGNPRQSPSQDLLKHQVQFGMSDVYQTNTQHLGRLDTFA